MPSPVSSRALRLLATRGLFALVTAAAAVPAIGAEPADSVQSRLDAALAEAMTTGDQLDAVATAQQEWDRQLNSVYRELQQELPAEAALALRDSQRAWLRFRDAEHAALQAYYASVDGSLHRVTHAMDRARLLQHRVAELEAWRGGLHPGEE